MKTRATILGALGLLVSSGCPGPLSENDLPCPCATGYTCCPALNKCVRQPAACPSSTVVFFGEDTVDSQGGSSFGNDTWTFDGTRWSQVSAPNPPAPRAGAAMATLGNEVVLFAGYGYNGDYGGGLIATNDTWAFDGTSWNPVSVSNPPPRPRFNAAMATLGNEVVLFGGQQAKNSNPGFLGDTWVFDGTSWTQVSASNGPANRAAGAMATLGNEVVLFGGNTGSGPSGDGGSDSGSYPLNDTWTFDGTSWTQVSVSSSPPARMYVAMAPLGNQVVLFGGYDSTSNLNDTWTFDGTAWMQVSALNVPPGLSGVMAMLPHGP